MPARRLAMIVVLLTAVVLGCRGGDRALGPGDRAWTLADYQRLAASERCGALPAFGSPAFDRMIDAHVIEALAPSTQPSMTRLSGLLDYQDALRTIMKRYAACGDVRGLLATSTAFVELMTVMLPLAGELVAGFSPDDPTYRARVDGLAQMRQGIVALVTGTATTVRGTSFRSAIPGVGRRLGTALARLRPMMPGDALAGPIATLDVPETDDTDGNRRALRADLRAGLHAAAPAPR